VNIGIYSEPAGATIGGAEYIVAVLAEALAKQHQVEIVHHRAELTSSLLAEHFALNLDAVRTRHIPYDKAHRPKRRGRWHRYNRLKSWHANLSEPYDLFINVTHGVPPFCHAKFGVLVVLFPMFKPFTVSPWVDDAPHRWSFMRTCMCRSYYEWEWKKRLQSYRKIVAISQFARKWTRDRWKVDCEVIYPPVNTRWATAEKANLILSVGRFIAAGTKKNQVEMASIFRKMLENGLCGWTFACVGSLGGSLPDRGYFEEVRRVMPSSKNQVLANVERAELAKLYGQAKIFWHATGYGSDEKSAPELMEHFGIATVESMAAGCVPVVINAGGQSEIVEHGVSGFLWNTLDELAEYTSQLINDDGLRARMSMAARARSQIFDQHNFIDRFQHLLKPFIS
jgi:glycosyltransferase involved in cell wall biosynthesis